MNGINSNKLKAKIMENEFTRADVAKMLGISANSLSRKLNGKTEFVLSEVVGLCDILNIDKPCEIFFLHCPKFSTITNPNKAKCTHVGTESGTSQKKSPPLNR